MSTTRECTFKQVTLFAWNAWWFANLASVLDLPTIRSSVSNDIATSTLTLLLLSVMVTLLQLILRIKEVEDHRLDSCLLM